jgi:hypothetical protein
VCHFPINFVYIINYRIYYAIDASCKYLYILLIIEYIMFYFIINYVLFFIHHFFINFVYIINYRIYYVLFLLLNNRCII